MGDRKSDTKKEVGAKKEVSAGKYDFMSVSVQWGIASIIAVTLCLGLIAFKGLNYGIDFVGGTEVQIQFKNQTESSQVRDFLKSINLGNAAVQTFGSNNEYLIRLEHFHGKTQEEENSKLTEAVNSLTAGIIKTFGENNATIRKVETVGPQVGDQLKRNGLLAIFYSFLAILIYVALRFDYNYAPGAVLCLFHDALLSVGVLVLLNKEISVQTLAAVLTIIGYSSYDTIVVFDRIREDMTKYRDHGLAWIVNKAVNETMGRTIRTSTTTFVAVTAMYIFAGGVIKDFAFIMGIGILFGVYSTIFIAAPLIILFERFKTAKQ